ncbi:hypothetical protein [Streptomyces sp. NPDC050804]|uniref:hypothetical protein n=1 Tax=Streptomyces sp. NPDC050804 TaxID=3154745 RepID=UPI00342D3590
MKMQRLRTSAVQHDVWTGTELQRRPAGKGSPEWSARRSAARAIDDAPGPGPDSLPQ